MRTSYENDEGAKVHGDRKLQTTTTRKFQSLSIFITSFFTTTPLALNCSSIICHHTSSILVEGEYLPSLKDCLIMSGSSSEAPTSTSNKTISHRFHRLSPATSNTSGAWILPRASLSRRLSTAFSLLSESCQNKRQHLRTGRHASAFEEKQNITRKRV
jgi:hypothetical protein